MVSLAKSILPWTFTSSVCHCYMYIFTHFSKHIELANFPPLSGKKLFGVPISNAVHVCLIQLILTSAYLLDIIH